MRWFDPAYNNLVVGSANTTFDGSETTLISQGGALREANLSDIGQAANFTPSGTGAVTRTIQSKLRDIVALADYSSLANFQAACVAQGGTGAYSIGGTWKVGNGSPNANISSGDTAHLLEVINDNLSNQCIRYTAYGVGPSLGGQNNCHWVRARGTQAAPTAVQSGDEFMSHGIRGAFDSSGVFSQSTGAFAASATETWTSTNQGTKFTLDATKKGSNSRVNIVNWQVEGITLPVQPAFLATATTTTNVTGDTTSVTVIWGTKIYDQGSNFASNTFTAPVTGKYHFDVTIKSNGMTASNTLFLVTLVATSRSVQLAFINPGGVLAGGGLTQTGGTDIDMTAGDTVTISFRADGTGKAVGYASDSTFSGHLVC